MGTENLFNKEANKWLSKVNLSYLPPGFEFMRAPWKVRNLEKGEMINKILGHSLKVQSSSIRGVHNLQYFILSNACLHVNSLLHYYLKAIEVQSTVLCGGFRFSKDGDGILHVFLDIDGQIVDNTYVHASEESVTSQKCFEEFFQMWKPIKTVEKYNRDPPSQTSLRLQSDSKSELEFQFMEISCSSELNLKKATAQAMSDRDHGAGIHAYDKLMRHYIREEFGVDIPAIAEEMKNVCWNCGECFSPDLLKKCSGCQDARYCGKECQVSDWKAGHRLMHKIIKRGKDSLLSRVS